MVKKRDPELERRRRQQFAQIAWMLLATGSHRTLTLDRVALEAGADSQRDIAGGADLQGDRPRS